MKPSKVQLEILRCLDDNNAEMAFDDLKYDLLLVSSPQGLGRSIKIMLSFGWVTTWAQETWGIIEHTIGLTTKGEAALRATGGGA